MSAYGSGAGPEYLDEPDDERDDYMEPDDWVGHEWRAQREEWMAELLRDMALDAQERGVGSTRYPLDLDDECPF